MLQMRLQELCQLNRNNTLRTRQAWSGEPPVTDKKHRSLAGNLAMLAGSIALICIAGAVSIFGSLALVLRFFGGH